MLCWPNGSTLAGPARTWVFLLFVSSGCYLHVFMRYLEEHIDRQYAQTDRLLYQDLLLEVKKRNGFALPSMRFCMRSTCDDFKSRCVNTGLEMEKIENDIRASMCFQALY